MKNLSLLFCSLLVFSRLNATTAPIPPKTELSRDVFLTKNLDSDLKKLFSAELNEKTALARAVQLTINSLELPTCAPAQKIRAYKSVGEETINLSRQLSSKETWLINPLWRDIWNSGKKVSSADLSWRKNEELKDWNKFTKKTSDGEVATEFLSFSLNPIYVSEQGPGYVVAEFCPDRVIFPPKVGKDLQELEVLIPLFVTPKEIISVKGVECLSFKDPLKQKDCAGILADNIQTLSLSSLTARKCYSNFAHEIEYKYMDDSPVDLTMIIRYEAIAKWFTQLLEGKAVGENYRKEMVAKLMSSCSSDCVGAKDFIEAMNELSNNGESEISADVIEADILKYKNSIVKQCGK